MPAVSRGVCDPFDLYPLRPGPELETLALMAVCVAGRSARIVWPKVADIRADATARSDCDGSPFAYIRRLSWQGLVEKNLRSRRMGQYTRIAAAMEGIARLPPTWTWRDLLPLPGVSYKSAKLVQVYTAPGQRAACLDRHVLRALARHRRVAKLGVGVPETSPTCPVAYAALEGVVCWWADELGLQPWEFDKVVWRAAEARRCPLEALEAARRC